MKVPAAYPTPIRFGGPEGLVEGLWSDPGRALAPAVLCHPHPGYGGSMHSKVVHTIHRVLAEAGRPTLRFNFRGVGRSEGATSGGNGEVGDVAAAAACARERTGRSEIWLAGFSFGAWVGLQWAAQDGHVARCVVLGLAPMKLPFDFLERPPAPLLVVQGERDRYGSAAEVGALVARLAQAGDATLVVVPGADHFFTGKLRDLAGVLREHLGHAGGAD